MSSRELSDTNASVPEADMAYERPQLVILGPVTKFTFGNSGSKNDQMTTKA